jgi:hypothetical protein
VRLRNQSRPLWTAIVAIPFLFIALAVLQQRIDAQTRPAADQKEELILPSGAMLKKLSLGYDSLLADIYWTRAIQYYGERIGTRHVKFDLLWPLLDVTTTLDPNMIPAYHFGAVFLSEPLPLGAGRTDLAVELVKRGIESNPNNWALYSDLGFLYYKRMKDYPNSSKAYLDGSKVPGAPDWLSLMAARVAEKGGSFETSRMIYTELYQSTKDPNVQKWAVKELRGLTALEDETQLNLLSEEYHQRFGHYPASTKEMWDAKLLPGIPADPAGYAYVIGEDGKAHLSPESPIEEPKH